MLLKYCGKRPLSIIVLFPQFHYQCVVCAYFMLYIYINIHGIYIYGINIHSIYIYPVHMCACVCMCIDFDGAKHLLFISSISKEI